MRLTRRPRRTGVDPTQIRRDLCDVEGEEPINGRVLAELGSEGPEEGPVSDWLVRGADDCV